MKVKLTKGELKRQRDALAQFERYLPMLQLKKQQLQIEILQQVNLLEEREQAFSRRKESVKAWAGLFTDGNILLKQWLAPKFVATGRKNIAGVDLAVFQRTDFDPAEYDLFTTPLWLDAAIEALRGIVSLEQEVKVVRQGVDILKQELRLTAQRVNLFEKVMIPQTREAIRLIKIHIGDQMANAVGRSKIAKRKIEEIMLEEAAVIF